MLNRIFLMGNLVAKPETKEVGGNALTRGRVAVSRRFRKKDGEWGEETLFIDFSIWGAPAERLAQRADRGDVVLIEGRLRQREWEDKDGNRRTAFEVAADRVVVVRKKSGGKEETVEEIEEIEEVEF
jgi:single-strand DNA-binding protein